MQEKEKHKKRKGREPEKGIIRKCKKKKSTKREKEENVRNARIKKKDKAM